MESLRDPGHADILQRTGVGLGDDQRLASARRSSLPLVTCDEKYGGKPAFLDGIATLGKWYLAEVPVDTRVWLRTPAIEPPGRPRLYSRVKSNVPRPLQLPRAVWH